MRGITCACTFLVVYASCTNVTNECTTEKCYKREKSSVCTEKAVDLWVSRLLVQDTKFSSSVATSTSWEPLFSQKGCQSTCKMCIHVYNVKSHTKPYVNTRGKPESRMYSMRKI